MGLRDTFCGCIASSDKPNIVSCVVTPAGIGVTGGTMTSGTLDTPALKRNAFS